MDPISWLKALFPSVVFGTTTLAPRSKLKLVGDGLTSVVDDPDNDQTVATFSGGTVTTDDASFGAAEEILSKVRRFSTATATVFSAYEYAIPANEGVDLVVTITGKDVASGAMYRNDLRVTYRRNGAGNASIFDALTTNEKRDGSLATATATIDLSVNLARVRISPVNAVDTRWNVTIQVQPVAGV